MGFDPSDHFPESEIEEFHEIFNLFDADSGGTLEADELQKVLSTLGKVSSMLLTCHRDNLLIALRSAVTAPLRIRT